ncbi:GTP-binding protein [Cryobacterium sp. LW097]|uniref:CobW family GTP-binding protein n=1 Tax=Cryobacterium sp. LW097 TaxID=1978566 RepID=UPI001F0BD696|nr:GTP-binding protein [Cryobacterium sp. LW097]
MIALTGHLGAGKTTLLNHLLRAPGARLGVVINDFGEINVDAGLTFGQIDEVAAISGGCVCCLPDAGGLDGALDRLTSPRLRLDAVIVEASGVAEPTELARLIRYSGVANVRPRGLIDVLDAVEHFTTVDTGGLAPARYSTASLIVINKIDRLPAGQRTAVPARIEQRIRERNPLARVIATARGRIDSALVFDAALGPAPDGELSFAALADPGGDQDRHPHADTVTVLARGPVDAGRLVDLLEDPPDGVYRLKGAIMVGSGASMRRYAVNVVGRYIHLARHATEAGADALVAIGMHLDTAVVRERLKRTVAPSSSGSAGIGLRRLTRLRRLSA